MTNHPSIDVEDLLAPLAGGVATGTDLRAAREPDSAYRTLKAARNDARVAERRHRESDEAGKGNWSPILPSAWKPIRAQALAALAKSKDLEIVGWLLEALVRTDGFPGLRDGLLLAQRMVEAFWNGLYPPLSAGLDDRLLFLTQLCGPPQGKGTLEDAIDAIPLTATTAREFARWHHRSVEDLEKRPADERQRRIAAGAVDPQELKRSKAIAGLKAQVQECIDGFDALVEAIEQASGTKAPNLGISTSGLEEILSDITKILESYSAEKPKVVQITTPPRSTNLAGSPGSHRPEGGADTETAAAAVGNRAQALQQLERVADYFAIAEPHSPLSHALLRIVKWGSMQFPELIDDLLGQSAARDTVFRLVGVDRSQAGARPALVLPNPVPSASQSDVNASPASKPTVDAGSNEQSPQPPWLRSS